MTRSWLYSNAIRSDGAGRSLVTGQTSSLADLAVSQPHISLCHSIPPQLEAFLVGLDRHGVST